MSSFNEFHLEFRYAMVNRPAGIGCAPKDGFLRLEDRPLPGQDHHEYARHGIAVYSRELSAQETRTFEMAPLLDEQSLSDMIEQISQNMSEYAEQYVQMAHNKDPRRVQLFAITVSDRLKSTSTSYTPSVGNFDNFVQRVAARLNELVQQNLEQQDGNREHQNAP